MKIKRKTFWGGIVAALCACTALTFGAVYSTNNKVTAHAATTAPASIVNLDSNGTAQTYFADLLTGAQNEKIFFGKNVTSLGGNKTGTIKWRVLSTGADNTYSNGNMLLWADYQLGKSKYNVYGDNPEYAYWGTSYIRARMNGGTYYNAVSGANYATVIPTATTSVSSTSSWYNQLFTADEKNSVVAADSYVTHDAGIDASLALTTYKKTGITTTSDNVKGKYNTNRINALSHPLSQYARYNATTGTVWEETSGDKLFLLDYYDINNLDYGFGEDTDGDGVLDRNYANKVDSSWTTSSNWFPSQCDGSSGTHNNGITASWLSFSGDAVGVSWLRNAVRLNESLSNAFFIQSSGRVDSITVSYSEYGIRPALNFNPNTVVYATSASHGTNGSTFEAVDTAISTSDGVPIYKVYLKSSAYQSYDSTWADAPTVTADSSAVTLSQSGQTGKAVILLVDKTNPGSVKYQATTDFNAGVATAALPSNVQAGEYAMTVLYMTTANTNAASETVNASFTQSSVIIPAKLTSPSGIVTTDYNGDIQSLKTITSKPAWYDQLVYTDPTVITLTPATVTDANETGYSVTAKIISQYYVWSNEATNPSKERTFTFKVNKKKLTINWTTDSDGYEVAQLADVNEIYSRDSGANYPKLVTKYYEQGTNPNGAVAKPTGLGTWVAVAVLDNAATCNYKVDDTKTFSVSKKQVAYPTPGGSASEVYDGTSQEFTFTDFDSDIMDFTVPNGVDSFDGETLYATNVGQYTPVYTLKNTSLYEWSTSSTPATAEITPKPVVIRPDSGNENEWEKKTVTALAFDVTTPLCGSDTTVNLVASYKLNGGNPLQIKSNNIVVNGTSCTVTIDSGFAKGTYILTVKVADGENYSGSVNYFFNITAQGLSLGNNDIEWNINGTTYVTSDYDNGNNVFTMQYTGTPLSLSNVSVDFSSASDAADLAPDGDLTGDFIGAVNVGEYEATFKIKAKNSDFSCTDGPFTIKINIVPQKLDFSKAQWEYTDDNGATWKQLTATNKPSYTGDPVSVRISPAYMLSLGLDASAGDYTTNYNNTDTYTQQGANTTNVYIAVNNSNYTTADESGSVTLSYNWEITARALTYTWKEKKQTVEVGENAFLFPAVEFADGNDYSQYFEYVYKIDVDNVTEYTLEELKEYIKDNWSDESPVSGTVIVRMKDGVTDVNINQSSYLFSTGKPKTAINVAVTGSGAEYGKVDFAIDILRGTATADESKRTSVTITGGTLESARTFDGDDTELIKFMNKLGAGSYTITVTLKTGNEDFYVLTQSEFEFEVLKCNVQLPTVREIVFTGETINLVDYLDGFDSTLMKLIGAAEGENGIVSGRDYRKSGYFTTIALLDGANYQFVKTAESGEAETLKATLKFAIAFADGDEVLGSEYEINWMINRFRITEDMWDKSGKQGATLKLPAQFAAMAADENLLKIAYSYYDDQNGAALEEFSFKGGNSYWVSATLEGEEANNFEFENGLQISDKTVYTVPQSKTEAFFNNTMTFVKNNMMLVIGCAAGLLLLILLIIIIACAARSRRKKREREELAEQRRLEKEEREREERKLEREERMARMSQQQMMMPQMMPQGMPQSGGHSMGGGSVGGSVSEAQILQMQAELAELKAEKLAKEAAQQQIAQAKADMQFAGFMAQLMGGGSMDKLTEIIRTEVRNALADEKAAHASAEHRAEEAKEVTPVCPPDAVMTTVTTTKIDTTKKAQNPERAAAPAPAARTVVRNLVAPMPVDDGRVFDVGGFYTPADPVTDMGSDDKTE